MHAYKVIGNIMSYKNGHYKTHYVCRGWGGGSIDKNTSFGTHAPFSVPMWWLITIYNYSSSESETFFGPLQVPGMKMAPTYKIYLRTPLKINPICTRLQHREKRGHPWPPQLSPPMAGSDVSRRLYFHLENSQARVDYLGDNPLILNSIGLYCVRCHQAMTARDTHCWHWQQGGHQSS